MWFVGSAVFHYLGPCFAVLLFPYIGVLGVACLRIGTAAAIFAPVTKPWRLWTLEDAEGRRLLLLLGFCLGAMNCCFYLALARLPVSLVAAIEFVGTIAVALYGFRTPRNLVALIVSVLGVGLLIDVRWSSDLIGLLWATLNGLLFVIYILLGHRAAEAGAAGGISRLGGAMLIAAVVVLPLGWKEASAAFESPILLAAAVGVGLCSSVIPYICDQLAMAQLPRATFALMLSLLPAVATLLGALVLRQMPSLRDLLGIALVMGAVAMHRPAADLGERRGAPADNSSRRAA